MTRTTGRNILLALLAVCLVLGMMGCKKPPKVEPTPTPVPTPAPTPVPTPAPKEVTEPFKEPPPPPPVELTAIDIKNRGLLKTVYFDLDKHDLTDNSRATLRANADWIKANTKWTIVIEGNCDERGTTEYNLELGGRRARSVRDFLVSLGIPESRLRTKSYGEERPVDPGHNEAAWAKNRRADFEVE